MSRRGNLPRLTRSADVGADQGIPPVAIENTRRRADREQLIRSLERRNQDLDQFAGVVSHDLKAPLRAIANLSQWIAEAEEHRMSSESKEQLGLLRQRVQRLGALVDGILKFTRAGRRDETPRPSTWASCSPRSSSCSMPIGAPG